MILCEEGIANYKKFKKSYTNGNNGLTLIVTSPEEDIQDSEMTEGENKEVVKYDKERNILIGQMKLCGL